MTGNALCLVPPANSLEQSGTLWIGRFTCMASACEILLDLDSRAEATNLVALASQEALRIEKKFSRYRDDNIVHEINQSAGEPLLVDSETALLLDFAENCFEMSDGLFDVTSGVLRRVWYFDGSDRLPASSDVEALLPLIGFDRVGWQNPRLKLPAGMELDFGGIGKEYAVDRVFELLLKATSAPCLVNFGGDLRASGKQRDGSAWRIGVENPYRIGGSALAAIQISNGALATSGDSRRFLLADGTRYSHILDPRSGWPVEDAPRSVTVAAPTAVEAGMLATLASLQGSDAEAFLVEQDVRHWVLR